MSSDSYIQISFYGIIYSKFDVIIIPIKNEMCNTIILKNLKVQHDLYVFKVGVGFFWFLMVSQHIVSGLLNSYKSNLLNSNATVLCYDSKN